MHHIHVCKRIFLVFVFQAYTGVLWCPSFANSATPRGPTPPTLEILTSGFHGRLHMGVGHVHTWWHPISLMLTLASSQLPKLVSMSSHGRFDDSKMVGFRPELAPIPSTCIECLVSEISWLGFGIWVVHACNQLNSSSSARCDSMCGIALGGGMEDGTNIAHILAHCS
jgi:hypothetical protein